MDKFVLHMQHEFVLRLPGACSMLGAMNPQTEEFLNFLLWSAGVLARPTFRSLTDSYEN